MRVSLPIWIGKAIRAFGRSRAAVAGLEFGLAAPALVFATVGVVELGGLLKEIRVQPSARFDRLEEVLVVRPSSGAPSLETPQTVQ